MDIVIIIKILLKFLAQRHRIFLLGSFIALSLASPGRTQEIQKEENFTPKSPEESHETPVIPEDIEDFLNSCDNTEPFDLPSTFQVVVYLSILLSISVHDSWSWFSSLR